MAKAIKHRRGTTEEHSTFVGLEGEITVDTTKKTLVVHDQETVGGFPLARESAVRALDEGTVHKIGNEVIEGNKTFTGDVSFVTPAHGDSSTKPATTEWVKENADSVPINTIIWSMSATVPAGYLLCNGATVTRAAYPELADARGVPEDAETFQLPDLIGRFVEGSNVAGVVKEAGLPNITGEHSYRNSLQFASSYSGAYEPYTKGELLSRSVLVGDVDVDIFYNRFDASRSNPIYGNSTTVQPPSVTALPCIKAYSAVVGDATLVAGQLVNDIMARTTPAQAAHSAMPSDRHIDLTLSTAWFNNSSNTRQHQSVHTAPADGWYSLVMRSQAVSEYINNFQSSVHYVDEDRATCVNEALSLLLPVKKNDIISILYTATGPVIQFRFIYAEGAY